jgi:excisionase family DNA binding protein
MKKETDNNLNAKPFLSVTEACQLVGISRRTIYRMIARNELTVGKFGKRTIIQRSAIESIFSKPTPKTEKEPENKPKAIKEWIGLTEIQEKYKVSSKALNDIIKRNNIPKLQEGIFVFVSKNHIDNIFNPKNNER